jgi:hypothetical protein
MLVEMARRLVEMARRLVEMARRLVEMARLVRTAAHSRSSGSSALRAVSLLHAESSAMHVSRLRERRL